MKVFSNRRRLLSRLGYRYRKKETGIVGKTLSLLMVLSLLLSLTMPMSMVVATETETEPVAATSESVVEENTISETTTENVSSERLTTTEASSLATSVNQNETTEVASDVQEPGTEVSESESAVNGNESSVVGQQTEEVSSSIETAEQNETSVENPSSGTKAAAPENNGTENAEDVDLDESSNSDVTDALEGQSPKSRNNSRALETVDKTGILTFHSTSSGSNVTYEMKLMRSYTNSSGELIEELVDIQSYVQQSSQQYTWTDLPQYIQVGDQQVEYDYYVKFSGLDNAYGSYYVIEEGMNIDVYTAYDYFKADVRYIDRTQNPEKEIYKWNFKEAFMFHLYDESDPSNVVVKENKYVNVQSDYNLDFYTTPSRRIIRPNDEISYILEQVNLQEQYGSGFEHIQFDDSKFKLNLNYTLKIEPGDRRVYKADYEFLLYNNESGSYEPIDGVPTFINYKTSDPEQGIITIEKNFNNNPPYYNGVIIASIRGNQTIASTPDLGSDSDLSNFETRQNEIQYADLEQKIKFIIIELDEDGNPLENAEPIVVKLPLNGVWQATVEGLKVGTTYRVKELRDDMSTPVSPRRPDFIVSGRPRANEGSEQISYRPPRFEYYVDLQLNEHYPHRVVKVKNYENPFALRAEKVWKDNDQVD
ncbi:MAG: hypothetical protein GX239_06335, partial [Clostridiaceae bacterium]|nr:hypothetical protein [Clostridiaceae bacterium]